MTILSIVGLVLFISIFVVLCIVAGLFLEIVRQVDEHQRH